VPSSTTTPVPSGPPGLPESLIEALRQARAWGFLGDGPLDVHIAHAQGFADAAENLTGTGTDLGSPSLDGEPAAGAWMDLGSGGGIPGLVLAHRWRDREAVFLDSNQRRAQFLARVVEDLGWGDRVRLVAERAEVVGRSQTFRGHFSLVVARAFGPPPVTAECAAPFLRLGGILIVSEPPGSSVDGNPEEARWPVDDLAKVGLRPVSRWHGAFGYQVLRQSAPCPPTFPRRVGVPGKRPLYRVGDG